MTGLPVIVGETIVLFVKVSVPVKVAIVPEVGKVTLLAAVVVIVKSPIPFVIILLPNGKKKIEQFKIFDIKRDILQHTNDMAKYLIL